ncbi:DNA-binding transcriptional ArsR family regulator [Nocardiopsis mwathae]|uniref:DNA-binding transcriptional ArsR family regulator n=1 Tax=Nocardiopsis mwathae TaxID=1472723 RepID=A0A7W9YFS2_9ACTN|nr:helix-turn-helix domain-containing protein [Nocardiopsis mwathae]MBB6171277.1 DNA-binding transcriptional ArsR family regulator [Nocardiopsis mwathae]
MLRIHFTGDDLARTRMAEGPDATWEIVLSLQMLGGSHGGLAFEEWRRACRRRIPPEARLLAPLVPNSNYFPDFLTPSGGPADLESRIDTVLGTPRRRLRTEMARLAADHRLPGWARAVADGEPDALHRIGEAMRACHREFIAPFAPAIRAHVDAVHTAHARAFLRGGAHTLLSGLGPPMRWRPPVLEADYPVDRDLVLGGRGLLLQPSFFCWRTPISLYDDDLLPVLVYPAPPALGWASDTGGSDPAGRALGRLLGSTRATMLELTASGSTTGELARRLRVTPAAASHHTSVLRDAGLIHSRRHGGRVLHTVTRLGAALLEEPAPRLRSGGRRTRAPHSREHTAPLGGRP